MFRSHDHSTTTRALQLVIIAMGVVIVLAGCSQRSAQTGPIEVNIDGFLARIYFGPNNIRLFLLDGERKSVNLENVSVLVSVGKTDKEVLFKLLIEKKEI